MNCYFLHLPLTASSFASAFTVFLVLASFHSNVNEAPPTFRFFTGTSESGMTSFDPHSVHQISANFFSDSTCFSHIYFHYDRHTQSNVRRFLLFYYVQITRGPEVRFSSVQFFLGEPVRTGERGKEEPEPARTCPHPRSPANSVNI